jgi:hypothetical protein
MQKLPHQLISGKQARLFSSLKLSNKELIATSTLLAVFRIVPELLAELIKDTGISINNRTALETFTEVGVAKSPNSKSDRPDGFIYIKNRNEWTSLVEAKVGNNSLNPEQVSKYVEDARANGIDAVITISNEFTPRVDQSPISLPKRLLTKVKLYHLSWRLILSSAILLKSKSQIEDREKSFVLDELIKFLRDDSVGNKSFTQMPMAWIDICNDASIGAKFKNSDPKVNEASSALMEEFSEIALNLTDHLGVECNTKLPNSSKNDRNAWQSHIAKTITDKKMGLCAFTIPNAANDLELEIDLAKNSITVGMELKAPEDRSTLSGKINWLSRQLKTLDDKKSFIKVRWKSRAADEFIELSKLEPDYFKGRELNTTILSFTPLMQLHSSKLFKSRKNFITELEKLVLEFYDIHAQYLKQWVPKAPKPIENIEIDDETQAL